MHDGKFHKVANVIGETMKLHPHGDASISEALVVKKDGEKLAERLCAVPWPELMKGLRPELEKFVREFREAENLAPRGEEELARYITDHERALLEFVQLELEGREKDSLEPIRALFA
jgi:hypothetical protein